MVAGRSVYLKFRTRARFIDTRNDLSAWCLEMGVQEAALEPLVWDVVALVDAPVSDLASMLRRRVPALAADLDEWSSVALAQRLRLAATRGETRLGG